jgi:hypothetical protein
MEIKMMKKMIMICMMLLWSNHIFADSKPSSCPQASEIIKVGLSSNLTRDNDGKWYAGRSAQYYGTFHKWTFVIGGITAANKNDALQKANHALKTLSYKSGPQSAPAEKWLCLYNNASNFLSGAVTPPINEYSTIKDIK